MIDDASLHNMKNCHGKEEIKKTKEKLIYIFKIVTTTVYKPHAMYFWMLIYDEFGTLHNKT
jgi:hypothetical protein